jgi:hypothetical protein
MICGLHVEQNGYYIVLVCVESGGPGWVGRVQRAGRAGWAAVPSRPHLRAVFACLSSLIGVRRDISGHLSQRVAVGPACHSGMRIACRLGRGPPRGASAQYRVIAGIAVPAVLHRHPIKLMRPDIVKTNIIGLAALGPRAWCIYLQNNSSIGLGLDVGH